jgi:hypothetical protein
MYRSNDRRWVSEPNGGIRRIVDFEAIKGGRYSARWGFSIEFVPKLKGRRLAWKRTLATADFDLCLDPIDVAGDPPKWCSIDTNDSVRRVGDVASAVHKAASSDFAGVTSLAELVQLFERRSRMAFRRFSLENYVQTESAWGLALLALGQDEESSVRLSRFCQQHNVDPATPLLAKAKILARRARQD